MKLSRILSGLGLLVLALLFISTMSTASAAKKKPKPVPPDKRVLVKSVNAAAGTIVLETMKDKTERTYSLDSVSVIKVNNSIGTIAQIKPGMQVRDSVERDSQTLDSIAVGYADPAPVAPK